MVEVERVSGPTYSESWTEASADRSAQRPRMHFDVQLPYLTVIFVRHNIAHCGRPETHPRNLATSRELRFG